MAKGRPRDGHGEGASVTRTYSAKEVFLTVQGEGGQAGRPAVFLRFAGCNLWSGLERDRATAICTFCDTHFVGTNGDGGGKFTTSEAMADHVAAMWRGRERDPKLVVCTGGEPLMQLDAPLIRASTPGGSKSPWKPTGRCRHPMASIGSASAQRPIRLFFKLPGRS